MLKKTLSNSKIESVIIPGGCTKYVQAQDVVWNRQFKAAGNMKSVPRRLVVEWITKSWEEISIGMMANSKKLCVLAPATDGSEDGLTSHFKEEKKNAKQAERYWKAKCSVSMMMNFTKILLKFSQKVYLTQHQFLTQST